VLSSCVVAALLASGAPEASLRAAWEAWPARRFVKTAAPCLRNAELVSSLHALAARHPGRLRLEDAGRSVEGRPLCLLTVGAGSRRVLLWSQMHGDEPSATPALLDLVDTLLDADPDGVLDRLTLLIVPMLNPDGAERYQRRNAQGIDINRDALLLATPEGRLLAALRERFAPELGFNLHDQNRRTTVGDGGVPATISLLAVAGDPQGTLTPGRARAKRVCARLARTLPELVPGGVARYDEDWNPRAFGDNLTAWGTPVVLIESGGLPPGRPQEELTRLNYAALRTVLSGLARDDLAGEDPAAYEGLGRNRDELRVDVLVSGGRVAQPVASLPYRADVAFDLLDGDPRLARCPGAPADGPSRIRELGDARLLSAARQIDATGRLIVPAFTASVRGLAARSWLDGAALDAVARLGVARLRWRVSRATRLEAEAFASRLEGPGRPAIEVVDSGGASLLRVVRRPGPPAGSTLGEALDALTGGTWRSGARGRSLPALLADLAGGPSGTDPPAPLLAPDQRASLLLLRPGEKDALDPGQLELERVFVDGREAGGAQ
jgi:hypothetical protein